MWWMIPALAGLSAVGGAVKSKSDAKEYARKMLQRKRRKAFSAFTGDPVSEEEPEKPSTMYSTLGGGIAGANVGFGLASGIQGLMQNRTNPYAVMNPYMNMQPNPYFQQAPNWLNMGY